MKSSKRAERLKYWQAINSAYEDSGLTIKDFCLSQGIHYKTFSNYRYRIKHSKFHSVLPEQSLSGFVPVAIQAESSIYKAQMSVNSSLPASSYSVLVLQLRDQFELQIPIEVVSKNLLYTVFSSLEVLR